MFYTPSNMFCCMRRNTCSMDQKTFERAPAIQSWSTVDQLCSTFPCKINLLSNSWSTFSTFLGKKSTCCSTVDQQVEFFKINMLNNCWVTFPSKIQLVTQLLSNFGSKNQLVTQQLINLLIPRLRRINMLINSWVTFFNLSPQNSTCWVTVE